MNDFVNLISWAGFSVSLEGKEYLWIELFLKCAMQCECFLRNNNVNKFVFAYFFN